MIAAHAGPKYCQKETAVFAKACSKLLLARYPQVYGIPCRWNRRRVETLFSKYGDVEAVVPETMTKGGNSHSPTGQSCSTMRYSIVMHIHKSMSYASSLHPLEAPQPTSSTTDIVHVSAMPYILHPKSGFHCVDIRPRCSNVRHPLLADSLM